MTALPDISRPAGDAPPLRAGRRAAAAVLLPVMLSACAAPGPVDERRAGADQATVARGEEIYAANCIGCHGGSEGGTIADLPPRHNAEGHTWHHADCTLLEIIAAGAPARPGLPDDVPTMPPFADELNADDRRAVLEFIRTWWTDEQRASQQQTTAQTCEAPTS